MELLGALVIMVLVGVLIFIAAGMLSAMCTLIAHIENDRED